MEFFKKISELGVTNIDIKIVEKNGSISVSFMPKSMAKDKALELIKPLMLTGTAEELDAEFFNIISEPVKKAAGIISNVESFEKTTEEADKNKAEKKTEPKEKGESPAPKPQKAVKEEKPKPSSPHQKYEDALTEIVGVEGFELHKKNRDLVKDKADMLLVMDKTNPIGKEWEDKVKEFDEYVNSLFYENDKEGPSDDVKEIPKIEKEKPKKETPIAPKEEIIEEAVVEEVKEVPSAPEPDEEDEDDFDFDIEDIDLDA